MPAIVSLIEDSSIVVIINIYRLIILYKYIGNILKDKVVRNIGV